MGSHRGIGSFVPSPSPNIGVYPDCPISLWWLVGWLPESSEVFDIACLQF